MKTAVLTLSLLFTLPLSAAHAAHLDKDPVPKEAPFEESGSSIDAMTTAGMVTLVAGYGLGLIPLLATSCDTDDSITECENAQSLGETLDYQPLWALLPMAGPWIIIAETDSALATGFFAVTGLAQAVGLTLLVVGYTQYEPEAPDFGSGLQLETGGLTLLSNGEEMIPSLVLGGTF
jgi:hypothetical protein